MTEKMPSSVMFGSRPMACRTRSYSSGEKPCSATICGVMDSLMPAPLGYRPGFVETPDLRYRRSPFVHSITEATMAVNPVPEGYHSLTPYLFIAGAGEAIRWYERALGATEILRLPMGDKIGHAEIRIGDSFLMLADEFPDMNRLGPLARGGPTSALLIYCEDVDALYARAVEAGATAERPPEDQFYGDRMGTFTDP